jgi:virulence factor Mce-like protein
MRGRGTVAGNPVLIGAATVLVVVVAVFLAYNANAGLPFVPSYSVKAELPSAAQLVVGNDVRIGGSRVGAVDGIQPRRLEDGRTIAVVSMKLDREVDPLPEDSTVLVRPRSALGLKYVEITRGREAGGYANGATIPLAAARTQPVEFDDFLNMFDERTRDAARANTIGFGDAFAGRGESINTAIGAFRPLLRDLVPVARNLASPQTNIRRFFGELGDAAAIVAPAAETQARLFVNLSTTMAALREVARPYIQESISEGPATLDTAIAELPRQRPFLANAEGLFAELRPGVRALRGAAPELSSALTVGTPTLRRAVSLNRRLKPLFAELQAFSEDPMVPRGIRALAGATRSLQPTLAYLEPAQTKCNYVTLWFRNVSSLLSEGDRNGTWQRFIIVTTPSGPQNPNNEGGPSSRPADGPSRENHLHTNPYPNTRSPGQPKECEAANEPYIAGRTIIGNVPGTQQAATEDTRPR